jgi:hypothetical protein
VLTVSLHNSVNSPMHVVSESYAALRMLHDWAATEFIRQQLYTHTHSRGWVIVLYFAALQYKPQVHHIRALEHTVCFLHTQLLSKCLKPLNRCSYNCFC